jgi:hypothetical protein
MTDIELDIVAEYASRTPGFAEKYLALARLYNLLDEDVSRLVGEEEHAQTLRRMDAEARSVLRNADVMNTAISVEDGDGSLPAFQVDPGQFEEVFNSELKADLCDVPKILSRLVPSSLPYVVMQARLELGI